MLQSSKFYDAMITLIISCSKKSEIKRYGNCIFQVQITNLIANILGEECLANLGFPDTDILDIINSVLESARLKPYSLEDTEADYKEDITKYEIITWYLELIMYVT